MMTTRKKSEITTDIFPANRETVITEPETLLTPIKESVTKDKTSHKPDKRLEYMAIKYLAGALDPSKVTDEIKKASLEILQGTFYK